MKANRPLFQCPAYHGVRHPPDVWWVAWRSSQKIRGWEPAGVAGDRRKPSLYRPQAAPPARDTEWSWSVLGPRLVGSDRLAARARTTVSLPATRLAPTLLRSSHRVGELEDLAYLCVHAAHPRCHEADAVDITCAGLSSAMVHIEAVVLCMCRAQFCGCTWPGHSRSTKLCQKPRICVRTPSHGARGVPASGGQRRLDTRDRGGSTLRYESAAERSGQQPVQTWIC